MTLRTIYLKTLREHFRGTLIWGAGLGIVSYALAYEYAKLLSGSGAKALFVSLQSAVTSFSFVFGSGPDIATVGGYYTYKVLIIIPIILGIYAILNAVKTIRGEEEDQILDFVLATPKLKSSIIIEKWLGITTSLAVICFLTGTGYYLGISVAKETEGFGNVMLACLDAFLLVFLFQNIALFLSQFNSRLKSSAITGGVLIVMYLFNSIGYAIQNLSFLRYLTPFYYYNLTKPLAISVGTNYYALLTILALSIPFIAATIYAYVVRDSYDYLTLFQFNTKVKEIDIYKEPNGFWLSNPALYIVSIYGKNSIYWILGCVLWLTLILQAFPSISSVFKNAASVFSIYKKAGLLLNSTTQLNNTIYGIAVMYILLIVFVVYGTTLVSAWSSEETKNYLEFLLSAPISRITLFLQRIGAALSFGVIVPFVFFGLTLIGNLIFNVNVDTLKLFETTAAIAVVMTCLISFGFLVFSISPDLTIGLLSAFLILSYLDDSIGSILKLPDWVINLSIFRQYGSPLTADILWKNQLTVVGVSLIMIIASVFFFSRRDISR